MRSLPGSLRDELAYRARSVLVAAKTAAGLSRRSDATFYVDRFSRALCSGRLGRNLGILSVGNDDGAGAQAQASMSALCFSRAHGLTYIHRPFTSVLFPDTDMPTWVRLWEEYFNLGAGERQLGDDDTPVVPLDRLDLSPTDEPVIVAANHYLRYCNQDPEAWERALPELRAKFWQHKRRPANSNEIRLAVHMRRGDVTSGNKKVANNFTPDSNFVNTLKRLKSLIGGKAPLRIDLFSQGTPEMFTHMTALGATLRLDASALDTHRALVEADILIMSKGAYSYTAGVLNEGIVLYDPQKYRPLKGWVVRAADGSFDEALLAQRLAPLLTRGGERT